MNQYREKQMNQYREKQIKYDKRMIDSMKKKLSSSFRTIFKIKYWWIIILMKYQRKKVNC